MANSGCRGERLGVSVFLWLSRLTRAHGWIRTEIMRTAVTPRGSWQVPDPLAVSPAVLQTASATLNEHAQTELSLEGDAARYRRPAEGQLPKTRQRLLFLQPRFMWRVLGMKAWPGDPIRTGSAGRPDRRSDC